MVRKFSKATKLTLENDINLEAGIFTSSGAFPAPSPDHSNVTSPFPSLLTGLTGSKPEDDIVSFAGYISLKPIRLRTKYYNADVTVWCDELPQPLSQSKSEFENGNPDKSKETGINEPFEDDGHADLDSAEHSIATLEDWKSQMLSATAKEVRDVIGGILLMLPFTTSTNISTILKSYQPIIEAANSLREAIEDENYDRSVSTVILVHSIGSKTVTQSDLDGLVENLHELLLQELGTVEWDCVAWNQSPSSDESTKRETNEYGEKLGIKRVMELLELQDWKANVNSEEDGEDGKDGEDFDFYDTPGLNSQPANILGGSNFESIDLDLQREMMDLKLSLQEQQDIANEDGTGQHEPLLSRPNASESQIADASIEQMPALLERVMAIREAGSEMTKSEREKFAKEKSVES